MKDLSSENFGVIIAFWLPGFVLLWALSYSIPGLTPLLIGYNVTTKGSETIGSFLYLTVASLSLGMIVSAIRWLLIDHFLYWVVRVKKPTTDFANLSKPGTFEAFKGLNENHYRYYQYYSNTLTAIVVGFLAYLEWGAVAPTLRVWIAVSLLAMALLLAAGDALQKYNTRVADILKPKGTSDD
jgi:hypothetical protein